MFSIRLLAHGRAEAHVELAAAVGGDQDGFLPRHRVVGVAVVPVQEHVVVDRQRRKIAVLDAEHDSFGHRIVRDGVVPSTDEFPGGEKEGLQGLDLAKGAEGVAPRLPGWGLRQSIAALRQLPKGIDYSTAGQRLKNIIQAMRVDERPLHGH